jgi:putative inorganic carbon (hco3(-)) transporter
MKALYYMKFLKIVLVCILILFPFGELVRFEIGNNIVLKPLDVTVILFSLVGIVYSLILNRTKIKSISNQWQSRTSISSFCIWYFQNKKRQMVFFIVSFICVGLFSLLVNAVWLKPIELISSSLYLLRWTAYASIFIVVLTFDDMFKLLLSKILLGIGFIIVLLGYIQYFFYSDLRNLFYFGWDDHMHRMVSVFLDPNFAGAFFVLYFILLAGVLVKDISKKNKSSVILCSSLLILALGAILLTYSRSALLMFLSSGITFLILINKKKFILGLIAVLGLFFVIASPFFYIENTNLLRTASTGARLETTNNAIQLFKDKPLLGVGFNAYRYAQIRYGFRDEHPKYVSHADAGSDNSLLFVLATTGILGLLAYLGIWFTVVKEARTHASKNNILGAIILSSLAGLFINALFINSLFYAPIMLWMWILILLLF